MVCFYAAVLGCVLMADSVQVEGENVKIGVDLMVGPIPVQDMLTKKPRPTRSFYLQCALMVQDTSSEKSIEFRGWGSNPAKALAFLKDDLGNQYKVADLGATSQFPGKIKTVSVSPGKGVVELLPFREVEGMAGLYRQWARRGATFHFVSASPWQLYEPLADFARQAGFPHSTYHLRRIRLKDRSVLSLLADPLTAKLQVIEPLMETYPQRRFILVGDSGERDPEVYAKIAEERPEQVLRIYIRDVTGQAADTPRYQATFGKLPENERFRLLWSQIQQGEKSRQARGPQPAVRFGLENPAVDLSYPLATIVRRMGERRKEHDRLILFDGGRTRYRRARVPDDERCATKE
jgi:hypothetical protein